MGIWYGGSKIHSNDLYIIWQTLHLQPVTGGFVVPFGDEPGVEAADSLVSHCAQVGVVLFPVSPDVSQRAAWNGDRCPSASLCWLWRHGAILGLRLLLGCLFCQAVLRKYTAWKETHEDARECETPPFHYPDNSQRMKWANGFRGLLLLWRGGKLIY